MARQLAPPEYSSNFHSHDPYPPPPPRYASSSSAYNPRRAENFGHVEIDRGSIRTTTDHHLHHLRHQTVPTTSSDTSSSLYNNNTSSFPQTQQEYHHPGSHVPALTSPSPGADAPHQNSPSLSDALADLEMAMSNAMSRNTVSPPRRDTELVHVIDVASSVLKEQASALRDQMEENIKLRSVLRHREQELQNFKIDQKRKGRQFRNGPQDDVLLRPSTPERSGLAQVSNGIIGDPSTMDDFSDDPLSSLIVHPDTRSQSEGNYQYPPSGLQGHPYVQHIGINGFVDSRNQQDIGLTQTSSPIDRAVRDGELDSRLRQELIPSPLNPLEESKQLKRQLADTKSEYLQLVYENQFLHRRIHELRQTIEKYQLQLIKKPALQEENERLKSEISVLNKDIHLYTSSLTALLVDFNLQPETEDPSAIVSAVKVLVQHLCDEGRRNSAPPNQLWHNSRLYSEAQQVSSSPPDHHAPRSPGPLGREMVPVYGQTERPHSPSSPFTHKEHHNHSYGSVRPNINQNIRGFHTENDLQNNSDEDSNPVRGGQVYDRDPHLPTLPEESSSDESDPLPGVEGLCINGEAVLGSNIKAYGISINGTKLCHFQWVRRNRDGSFFHIPGAAQPEYTITADDVDTLLSLECTPMDERNRKGNMVQVFVNDKNFITLDNDIKEQLDEYLHYEQATFEVKLGVESSQDSPFEPATLTLRRSGYELKKLNGKKVVASEKYASESPVEIRVGKGCQCAIRNSTGVNQLLDCGDNRTRDLLVLTMRGFIKLAIDRRRTKKGFWK